MGIKAEQDLYERMGLDFQLLDSGCCGLAGSFGFEHEHHTAQVIKMAMDRPDLVLDHGERPPGE